MSSPTLTMHQRVQLSVAGAVTNLKYSLRQKKDGCVGRIVWINGSEEFIALRPVGCRTTRLVLRAEWFEPHPKQGRR